MQEADMLMSLWRALPRRDGGLLPRRSDLSIGAVGPFLSSCWQISWRDGQCFTMDFMGERLIEVWGRDPSGLDLLAALPDYEIARIAAINRMIFSRPCAVEVTRRLRKGEGGEYRLTNWSLPMLDHAGQPTVIFGMSHFVREHQERPYSGKLAFIGSDILEAHFIDLGYGVPGDIPLKASA